MSLSLAKAPWPSSRAHIVNVAVLSLLVLGSWLVFPDLPERIPVHFALDGRPDAWSDRSLLGWMALPLVAGVVAALTYGSAWFVALKPESMNLPDRKRYEALSLADKFEVVSVVQRALFWITAAITTTLLGLHAGAWQVAMGMSEVLPMWSRVMLLLMVVASPIGTVVVLSRTSGVVSRLTKKKPPHAA